MDDTKPAPGSHNWQPRPSDAIDLATLRWYALAMERLAIEIYVSNRGKFGDLDTLLRRQLAELGEMGRDFALTAPDCPDGWLLCRDGLCSPACDSEF